METNERRVVDPKHIFLVPISIYERHGWWNYELFMFLVQSTVRYAREHGLKITLNPAHNFVPAPAARNCVGKAMLENTDAGWLMMIDNDIRPHENLLDMIVHAPPEADIVSPPMHMWDNRKGQVFLCWRPKQEVSEKGLWEYKEKVWVPLDTTGTGAIAIRRHVLEKMAYPWFQYEFDENYQLTTSEDIYFTSRASKAGFNVMGYTKTPCGHFHTVDLQLIPPREEALTNEPSKSSAAAQSRPAPTPEASPSPAPPTSSSRDTSPLARASE